MRTKKNEKPSTTENQEPKAAPTYELVATTSSGVSSALILLSEQDATTAYADALRLGECGEKKTSSKSPFHVLLSLRIDGNVTKSAILAEGGESGADMDAIVIMALTYAHRRQLTRIRKAEASRIDAERKAAAMAKKAENAYTGMAMLDAA